ncbi:MAG: addiction module protein [Candidatus Sumerlaeota bacterium]|nr:addiction module protein [Candidatus Sumerlaeota bacterium]
MKATVDDIYKKALLLPDDSKESLAERLVAYLEANVDPDVERSHIDLAKRRRDEARAGQAPTVDGKTVLAQARRMAKR